MAYPPKGLSAPTLRLENGQRLWLADEHQVGSARYSDYEIHHCSQYLQKGFELQATDNVVDVGANVGVFAMYAASKAFEGKVIAIEPTSAIDSLRLSIEKNNLRNVIPIQAAIGLENEVWEFMNYPGFNIINHRTNWKPAFFTRLAVRVYYSRYYVKPYVEKAKVRTLESVFQEQKLGRIDYLKVDCEGGEYDIFRTATRNCLKNVRKCVIEFHEYQAGQRHQELLEILRSHGFKTEVKKPFVDYYLMRFGKIWAWRE